MAFTLRNLSVLAYANGFTLWHYKAMGENSGSAMTPDFFSQAGDMLAAGDMVMVSSAAGGCVLCVIPGQTGHQTTALATAA